MHAAVGVLVVLFALGVLVRTVQAAREAHGGVSRTARPASRSRLRMPGLPAPRTPSGPSGGTAPRTSRRGLGWLEHRRHIRMERLKHEHGLARESQKHQHGLLRRYAEHRIRMAEREAEHEQRQPHARTRPADTPEAPASPGSETPRRTARETIRMRIRRFGGEDVADVEDPPGPATPPPSPPSPGPGSGPEPAMPPPVSPLDPAPFPAPQPSQQGPSPQPSQAPESPPTGGTPMTHAAVEQAVDGIYRIHQRAAAGNIRSKQWAIKVCAEVFTRISQLMLMMSRTVTEAGYGPEITEPMLRAAVQAQAAAMALGESDAAITSLANMRVGDLADSPRQAPERSELQENGAR